MNIKTQSFESPVSDTSDNFLIGGDEPMLHTPATATPPIYCPMCWETLHTLNREGILIDVCPQCRGVWLDRGELDRIIARTSATLK